MNFLLLLNTKEDILMNVSSIGLTSSYFLFHIIEVDGVYQLFGYPYSSKYLLFCLAEERNSCRFETT